MALLLIISLNIPVNVHYSPQDLNIIEEGNRHRIEIEGCLPSWEVGNPEVLVNSIIIKIPNNCEVQNYHVSNIHYTLLLGTYNLRPVPRPQILSLEPKLEPEPNYAIYNSNEQYPKETIKFQGVHNLCGERVAEFLIYPVRYYPSSGKLEILEQLSINLQLRYLDKLPRADVVDYLIITNSTMKNSFQQLADWKRQLGFKTWIREVSWITNHYTGRDNQEKIRNYIKTLQDSGIDYILLGGDTDVVPCRFAYAMTCSAGMHPREDDLPCDLYYADLDGSWDRNNNNIFGEIADSIDLYPDLLIGRATVTNISEAQAFVNKTITYESSPPSAYLTNALFAAEYLWPGTDAGLSKDKIGDESFPGYYTLTKLYERLGNETPQAVINAIEQGQEFVNHCGHGWIDIMSCGTGYLRNSDMDGLNNPDKYGILYTIGCWTTAYDYDCIAEHYVFNPNGGGIAFIGNSSYGWGSPDNPLFGYSDRFDQRFFHELFIEKHNRLGSALAYDKIHFIPYSREENVYRWHQYQLNLLGDPAVMVYTQTPENPTVDIPDSLPVSSSGIMVTVRENSNPIENAMVCLRKGNEWFSMVKTDQEGKAILNYQFQSTGYCTTMVSAHNYYPFEKVITVFSAPYPNPVSYFYDDRLGNNDSIPNPQESIYLTLTIKNEGDQSTQNLDLTLRINDPNFSVQDSTESTGPLNPDEEVSLTDAFQFDIQSVDNGYTGYFELDIQSGSRLYTYKIPIQVGLPEFDIIKISFLDPPAMPGDSDDVRIYFKNTGLGKGHNCYTLFSSSDPELTLYQDSIHLGDVEPDAELTMDLPIGISSSCPLGHIGNIVTDFHTDDYTQTDTISFVVGDVGFTDDLESGSGKWQSGGSNNLWHLTEYRSYSATHSFYCGNESNHKYVNNMDCYIESDPIILDRDFELRFWRWFIATLYGTDGLYVIIRDGSQSDTLDFIGSGGALGGGDEIPSDWFEECYDLSCYQLGDTIRLRLSFVSDNDGDVAEGFYLDDIYIGPKLPGVRLRDGQEAKLFSIRPIPFSNLLLINLDSSNSEIVIYNTMGAMVKSIKPKSKLVRIDTRNLASGVYFIRVTSGKSEKLRKVVKVR